MEGRTATSSPPDARAADLYGRYYAQIERYCRARLRNREEAEDAVQSTFIRVTTALRKGVRPELEAPWLYKIAHNVCLSRIAEKREAAADLAALEEQIAAPDLTRPDRLIGLEEALAEMPENLRRVILLREWQGLSYAEIAEETGKTQSAVESLIFRARRHLAKALGALGIPWPLKFAAGTAIVAGLAGGGLVVAHQTRPADAQTMATPVVSSTRVATSTRVGDPTRVVLVRTIAAAQPRQSPRPQVSETRSTLRPAVRVAPQAKPQATTVAAASAPTTLQPVPEQPPAPKPAVATPAPAPPADDPAPTTTTEEQPAVTTSLAAAVADAPTVSVPAVELPALPAVPDVTVPTVTVPPVPTLP